MWMELCCLGANRCDVTADGRLAPQSRAYHLPFGHDRGHLMHAREVLSASEPQPRGAEVHGNRPIDEMPSASVSELAFAPLEVTVHIFPGGSLNLNNPGRYSSISRPFGPLQP